MSKSIRILHHLPPKHYYAGGFAEVAYCTVCKTLAFSRDMWPSLPCPRCGNLYRTRLHFRARWIDTTPKRMWWNILSWFPRTKGYWDLSVESILNDIPDEEDHLKKSLWGGGYGESSI